MKHSSAHYVLLMFVLALPAHGAQFGEVLATLPAESFEGGSADFIEYVTWIDEPPSAHYRCRETDGTATRLELWQGSATRSRDKFGEQPLKYGENGSVRVFSITDGNDKPRMAAYFMLPSGGTYLFRLDASSRGVTKDGKQFQCERVTMTVE